MRSYVRFRSILAVTFLVTSLTATGCKKKPEEQKTSITASGGSGSAAGSAAGSATGSAQGAGSGSADGSGSAGSAAAGAGDGSAAAATDMAKRGGKCPSLVATATAQVGKHKDAADRALVTITATDKNAITTVQARAAAWASQKRADSGAPGHNGLGSQGGEDGLCVLGVPGVSVDKVETTATGVAVHVKFADATKATELLAALNQRAADGAAWVAANLKPEVGGQGGTGDGGGDHGRNHTGKGDARGKEKPNAKTGEGTGGGKKDGTGGGDKVGSGSGHGGGGGTGGGKQNGTGGGTGGGDGSGK
ncbi:MAG: hypothetical protein KBG28_22735 [Kofleriaceae bacterium]|nr:hypothetical protein [Kofleriaceae bacterium]MBP6837596.1 hypothetical protein [Kofleriaceae bacterium]MBP9206806.1 hypothetical protein [Kofleriaceae bacterium]